MRSMVWLVDAAEKPGAAGETERICKWKNRI
jgi:hypothetical protein